MFDNNVLICKFGVEYFQKKYFLVENQKLWLPVIHHKKNMLTMFQVLWERDGILVYVYEIMNGIFTLKLTYLASKLLMSRFEGIEGYFFDQALFKKKNTTFYFVL